MNLDNYRKKYINWATKNSLSPNLQQNALKIFGSDFQLKTSAKLIDNVDMDGDPFGHTRSDLIRKYPGIKYWSERFSNKDFSKNYLDDHDMKMLRRITKNEEYTKAYHKLRGTHVMDDINNIPNDAINSVFKYVLKTDYLDENELSAVEEIFDQHVIRIHKNTVEETLKARKKTLLDKLKEKNFSNRQISKINSLMQPYDYQ